MPGNKPTNIRAPARNWIIMGIIGIAFGLIGGTGLLIWVYSASVELGGAIIFSIQNDIFVLGLLFILLGLLIYKIQGIRWFFIGVFIGIILSYLFAYVIWIPRIAASIPGAI